MKKFIIFFTISGGYVPRVSCGCVHALMGTLNTNINLYLNLLYVYEYRTHVSYENKFCSDDLKSFLTHVSYENKFCSDDLKSFLTSFLSTDSFIPTKSAVSDRMCR